MKNIRVCMACFAVYDSDGHPVVSWTSLVKLLLIPSGVSITKEICSKCEIDIPEKYWEEILKK